MNALYRARILDGLALVLMPAWLRRGAGVPEGRGVRVARVLGGRQLLQAGIAGSHPGARGLRIGAAVDGLHAASMVLVGAVVTPVRRPALMSAAAAGGFAFAGARLARSAAPSGGG